MVLIFLKRQNTPETEALILKNEKYFRALIEKSTDMITLSTGDGEIIYLSPSVTKQFGYTLEDITSTPAFNFIHPLMMLQHFVEERNQLLKTPGENL